MKIGLLSGVGIGVAVLVYVGLQSSLDRPSINKLPIPPEAAISIALKEEGKNYTQETDRKDFQIEYVYIAGNGSFFESNLDSNSIGKYLGRSEPTKTGGNYFAWKITNKNDNRTFFIDQLDGEIISQYYILYDLHL
jgi:hypothetical protein